MSIQPAGNQSHCFKEKPNIVRNLNTYFKMQFLAFRYIWFSGKKEKFLNPINSSSIISTVTLLRQVMQEIMLAP